MWQWSLANQVKEEGSPCRCNGHGWLTFRTLVWGRQKALTLTKTYLKHSKTHQPHQRGPKGSGQLCFIPRPIGRHLVIKTLNPISLEIRNWETLPSKPAKWDKSSRIGLEDALWAVIRLFRWDWLMQLNSAKKSWTEAPSQQPTPMKSNLLSTKNQSALPLESESSADQKSPWERRFKSFTEWSTNTTHSKKLQENFGSVSNEFHSSVSKLERIQSF